MHSLRWKISFLKMETLAGGFGVVKKYFIVHHTLEEQKVEIAFLYLSKVADIWYHGWLAKFDTLN